jgi:ABC-type transport system involved in cytochrome bd biosynthesis fused ATPase/permease subunit
VDPWGCSTDEEITIALAKVGLGDGIRDRGGLNAVYEEEMLSHGQKQLFFLARAILRKGAGRVVLMDEATSRYSAVFRTLSFVLTWCSMDQHTVTLVRNIAHQERFKELWDGRHRESGTPS